MKGGLPMRALAISLSLLTVLNATPSMAQKTASVLLGEISADIPSGNPAVLTAASLRGVLNDIVNSSANLASGIDISISPSLSVSPTGNPTSGSLLTTYSSFNVQSTAASATNREFLFGCGLTSAIGSGIIGTVNDAKVCGYFGVVGNSGTGSIWALNSVTSLASGSGSYSAQGYEVDVNNFVANRLATTNSFNLANPFVAGVNVSGDPLSLGAYRNTYAFVLGGGAWQYGFAVFSDVSDSAFYEATSPGSTYGLNLEGSHTYGVYVNSDTAVNVFNGPVGVNLQGNSILGGAPANNPPGIALDVRVGTNDRFTLQPPVDLSSGVALFVVNDANSATRDLEIGAATVLFSGPSTLFGTNGGNIGSIGLAGSTSGTVTIQPQAIAGTPTLTLPNASGTIAVSASGGISLNATTGNITTNGGITQTCTVDQAKTLVFTNGILTGGTCNS
jgi:hypothetical protein